MPSFLDSQALKHSVERLAQCAAKPTLTDYLIFKRALRLARDDHGLRGTRGRSQQWRAARR